MNFREQFKQHKFKYVLISTLLVGAIGLIIYYFTTTTNLNDEEITSSIVQRNDSNSINIIKKEKYKNYCLVLYKSSEDIEVLILKRVFLGRYEYYGMASEITKDHDGINYGVFKTAETKSDGIEQLTIVFGDNSRLKAKKITLFYENCKVEFNVPVDEYFIIANERWNKENDSPEIKLQ